MRAIFGEKAREVRDTSLKVPHGDYGIVVDAKVFTRENGDELSSGSKSGRPHLHCTEDERSPSAIRWQAVMVTRVLFPVCSLWKICLSCPTVVRWISC